jgi:integrase
MTTALSGTVTDNNSISPIGRDKPSKPYPEFPLFPHATGRWAKKIRGKLHYFGAWADPDGALAKYLEQKDDLHAGRKPRPKSEDLNVRDLCNAFLNQKQTLVDGGELSPRTWTDYKDACDQVIAAFGKIRSVTDLQPDDFTSLRNKMARKYGPHRLGKLIQCVRSVFLYAFDQEMIETPIRYGKGFKRPSKKTLRLHRAKQGKKLFTREEIHKLLGAASLPLKAMILLGINCGFGNADCGMLPMSALDLEGGWHNYPRPKTGIERRCPLWPETVAAIKEAQTSRPEPKKAEHAGLVFITKYGQPWAKNTADNTLAKETGKLMRILRINGRKGLGFYTLRHSFRTVADESRDQVAVDFIMGHAKDDMASLYREGISDERLRAVTDHVHAWLFGVT